MAAPSTARKRLLVFCDGTNQDGLIASEWIFRVSPSINFIPADDGTSYDDDAPLYFTNVVRLCEYSCLCLSLIDLTPSSKSCVARGNVPRVGPKSPFESLSQHGIAARKSCNWFTINQALEQSLTFAATPAVTS